MGGVVSAIGDVVGGVADAVGSVAEAAVDVASTVVESVASNPILGVAAAATGVGLAGLAAEAAGGVAAGAVAGAGVDAAAMGLIGPTMLGAAGATEAALSAAALSAGAGAGILGAAEAGGLSLLPAAAGATEALGGAGTAAGAASAADAASGAGFVGSTGEIGPTSLISSVPDASTAVSNAVNSIATSNTPLAVDSAVQNTTYQVASSGGSFMDQINAAQLMNQGVPYQQVIQSVSNGSLIPNPISEVYNSVSTGFKNISDAANGFVNGIGQHLLPGADPILQKAASNFVVNTALTGDPEAALKNTALGLGGQWAGQQVFNQTGSNVLANATKAGVSAGLGSGDIGTGLISAGIAGGGTEVGNLTGSPFLGKTAGTLAGTALSGGDLGNAAINIGASQFSPLVGQVVKTALGPDVPAPVANVAQRVAQNVTQNTVTGAPKTVSTQSLVGPLASNLVPPSGTTTQTSNAPLQIASNALTSAIKRSAPPQVVALSNLIPIAYNSSLSNILKQYQTG